MSGTTNGFLQHTTDMTEESSSCPVTDGNHKRLQENTENTHRHLHVYITAVLVKTKVG